MDRRAGDLQPGSAVDSVGYHLDGKDAGPHFRVEVTRRVVRQQRCYGHLVAVAARSRVGVPEPLKIPGVVEPQLPSDAGDDVVDKRQRES